MLDNSAIEVSKRHRATLACSYTWSKITLGSPLHPTSLTMEQLTRVFVCRVCGTPSEANADAVTQNRKIFFLR